MTDFILKNETLNESAQVHLTGKNTKSMSNKLADWILSNDDFQKYHYEETETGLAEVLCKWLKNEQIENPVKINTEKYIVEMELIVNSKDIKIKDAPRKQVTLKLVFRGYNKLKSVKKRILVLDKELEFQVINLENHSIL